MGRTLCTPGFWPRLAGAYYNLRGGGTGRCLQFLPLAHVRALVVAAAVVLPSAAGVAQAQPAGVQPGAIEREYREETQPRPTPDVSIPSLESPRAWENSQSVKFVLTRVDIEGNAAIADELLSRPFDDLLGREVSVGQIFAAAEAITRIYDASGYALSLAYVPAQEVKGGVVLIRVVEGYVGEVAIKDSQSSRSERWDSFAERLKESRPLRTEVLERYLLLISDQAGVKARSFFERIANGEPGATRLVMNIERKLVDGHVEVNNRGSAAVGPFRGFLNLDFNGILGSEESLNLFAVATPDGAKLAYFGGRIELPVSSEGTVISVEAAHSKTKPGTPTLAAIEFEGDGWTGSARVSHSFIRSLRENLYASVGVAYKNLKSRMAGSENSHDKLTALELAIDYDSRDRWGGLWHVVGMLLVGLDIFDATERSDPLSSRAGASGQFVKFEASVSRLTSLSRYISLYGELAGQVADGPLLVSELCGYGGGYIGRAFDSFEVTGDHCIKGRAELRFDLPLGERAAGSIFDSAQLYILADFGVMMKSGTLLPGELRVEDAGSVGLGWRFRANDYLSGYFEVAHPLNRGVAFENGARDARLFFGVSADY